VLFPYLEKYRNYYSLVLFIIQNFVNMNTEDTFVNKVANSGIITIDLEKYYPSNPFVTFDLQPHLFMGLIVKEKDFRAALKELDWQQYAQKNVCIICSTDAIIPVWAYMLVTSYLKPVAHHVYHASIEQAIEQCIIEKINNINLTDFKDQRIVIKGCGEKQIGAAAYVAITALLQPVAKSIMYGEPCSTVPIFKSKPQQF
jgi:hypothetical protein